MQNHALPIWQSVPAGIGLMGRLNPRIMRPQCGRPAASCTLHAACVLRAACLPCACVRPWCAPVPVCAVLQRNAVAEAISVSRPLVMDKRHLVSRDRQQRLGLALIRRGSALEAPHYLVIRGPFGTPQIYLDTRTRTHTHTQAAAARASTPMWLAHCCRTYRPSVTGPSPTQPQRKARNAICTMSCPAGLLQITSHAPCWRIERRPAAVSSAP